MAETTQVQGPRDFTVQKPQPIQVNAPLANQVARSGVRPNEIQAREAGSNHREAMDVLSSISAGTMRALSAFSPIIAEKLKDAQENEFADGYMRHLQGESVASIAEQQPFSGIFGDGPAVRGARMRQQETAGQSLVQYVQQNQGDLSRMPLDEQRVVLGKFISDMGTGDVAADALVAQGAMKMLPAVLDNLARTSEMENQRQAQVHQADAMAAGGESYKYARSQYEQGQLSESQYQAIKANYIELASPLPGQTETSYRAALTGQLMQLSRDGSHEMANLLYDNVLKGTLMPEERIQMEAQMKASQADWLLNNPTSYDYTSYRATLGAQIDGGRYSTTEELTADIDRVNADYKAQTGALDPLIDNKEKARQVATWMTFKQRNDATNAKLMQGELDEAAKLGLYKEGYAKGSPQQMEISGLDKKGQYAVESNEAGRFMDGNEASSRTLGRLAANGHTNPVITEFIGNQLGLVRGGGIPTSENMQKLQQIYNQFKGTPYGAAAVDAYFKDDAGLVDKIATMDLSDKQNIQSIREMANAQRTKLSVSKETQTAASDLVDSELKPGWWSRTVGEGQQLGAGYEASLKDEMKNNVAEVMAQYPNWSEDNVMKAAQARTMAGKDIAGNMVITGGRPGSFIKGLNEHLDIKVADPKDTRVNTFVNDAIKSKVPNDMGFNVGSLAMLPDGQTLVATVVRDNGGSQSMVLRLNEIAAVQNSKAKRKVTKERASEVKPAGMAKGFVDEAQRQEAFKQRQK